MEAAVKRLISAVLAIALLLTACSCAPQKQTDSGTKIVCASFVEYDWARAITQNTDANVILLADNGADMHSYLPTAHDIIEIASADLFIYCGGSSESWADKLLQTSAKDTRAIEMMQYAHLVHEEHIEGMEEHHDHDDEYDEHVWLSLKNAAEICDGICTALCEIDENNAQIYRKNTDEYKGKLNALERDFKEKLAHCRGNTLLFAGRFAFAYLLHDYSIDYYAAFEGCSAETEASFETVAFLAQKADELGIKYEIVPKGDDDQLADTIAQNVKKTQLEKLYLDPMQSASGEVSGDGTIYLTLMGKNLDAIIEALS